MKPIKTEPAEMSMAMVDEESGFAQGMPVTSLFPSFSPRSYSVDSKCLFITSEEHDDVNIWQWNWFIRGGES